MSHYKDYVSERLGKHVYECPQGFAVYYYLPHDEYGQTLYIEDIYIAPEYRRKGFASEIADHICDEARGKGVKVMFGSIYPKANKCTESLKGLLAYGMQISHVGGDGLIYLIKDLED